MSRTGSEMRQSENQSKFIQDRITSVEKHFGDFCTNIAAFTRKASRMRDKGDLIAQSVRVYAEHETHNPSAHKSLTQFSEGFSAVQDYRDSEIRRLEDRVIHPLMQYGNACKHAKERLKIAFAARDKELRQKKNLDKVRDKNPSNRHQIAREKEERKNQKKLQKNKEEHNSGDSKYLTDTSSESDEEVESVLRRKKNKNIHKHDKRYKDKYYNMDKINNVSGKEGKHDETHNVGGEWVRNKRKKDKSKDKHIALGKEKKTMTDDNMDNEEAQEELHRASADASRSSRSLEEEMDSFEKKKLGDIKTILGEFVQIELMFHAKALEMYTQCYQSLMNMNEDEDLEEFRNSLHPPSTQTRLEMQHAVSKTSLNTTLNTTGRSLGQVSTASSSRNTPVANRRGTQRTPSSASRQSRSQNSYTPPARRAGQNDMYAEDSQDDDEEEEEDDDEEEEEEDDEEDDEYARSFQRK